MRTPHCQCVGNNRVDLGVWSVPGGDEHVERQVIPNRTVRRILEEHVEEQPTWWHIDQDPVTEIGVHLFLRDLNPPGCPHLVYARGCRSQGDATWLLTEFEPFWDVIQEPARRVIRQVIVACKYLHDHNIGHRNISEDSLLCQENANGQSVCKLMDFHQVVPLRPVRRETAELLHYAGVYRYFSDCGKADSRAPEARIPRTVPRDTFENVHCPSALVADDGPVQTPRGPYLCEWRFEDGAVPGQISRATIAGYAAAPVDTFAIGTLFVILMTGARQWTRTERSNPEFEEFYLHMIREKGFPPRWGPWPPDALEVCRNMIDPNPAERWGLQQCLDRTAAW